MTVVVDFHTRCAHGMKGSLGGPIIAGVVADRTGSYETGFRILAGLAALGSIFFVLARRPSPPRRRG